jgi:hypothetical protein
MKVLYVASNPQDADSLRVQQDITEIQKATAQYSGDIVRFTFLPALPFEEIEEQISIYKPDILHLAAHGSDDNLWMSNTKENAVKLTADSLKAVLTAHCPRLVYINACRSQQIAEKLTSDIKFSIGTTALISNLAARKSAVTFYRCLLRGQTLEAAYNASAAIVRTLASEELEEPDDDGESLSPELAGAKPPVVVETRLFTAAGTSPKSEVFYRLPRLVATFKDHQFISRNNRFSFNIGICGASENTMQVVFCTDDESFISGKKDVTEYLCSATRTNAINGEVWLDYTWYDIFGDFRLYALATTASGRCYSVGGTLWEALMNFYEVYYASESGPEISFGTFDRI